MSSRIVSLRDEVHTAIQAAKSATEYVYNDFELIKSYGDFRQLKGTSNGIVSVKGLGFDEERLDRAKSKQAEIPVQIGLLNLVSPEDTSSLDTLVELYEELMETCKNDFLGSISFTWQRTRVLRESEESLPYDFNLLLTDSVFFVAFTSFYKVVQ